MNAGQAPNLPDVLLQVRRLKKVQKLSGTMMVNARRQSLGVSPGPAAGLEGTPLRPPAPHQAVDAEAGAELDELAEDEEFAISEHAHMWVPC